MYIIKIEEEYWDGWKWDRKQKNKIFVPAEKKNAKVLNCHFDYIRELLIECLGFENYKRIEIIETKEK